MKKPSVLPYLWMLSGSLVFSFMAACAHELRHWCDWQLIALARASFALVFAGVLTVAAGARLVFLRPAVLWVRSVAGSCSMVLTFFAFTRLPVSDVLTLTNMFPVWVAFLSWPLLGEAPPGHVWLSVGSAVFGVVLIQQPHLAEGNHYAILAALAASVFTAFAMMGLHRLRDIDARAIVVHFSGVAVLFCTASLLLFDRRAQADEAFGSRPLVLLLVLGVTATVGQLFLTKAFTFGPPARVSVVGLTQVVFAMLLDMAFFGRTFNRTTLLGIALIVGPTAWLVGYQAWQERTKEEYEQVAEGMGGQGDKVTG